MSRRYINFCFHKCFFFFKWEGRMKLGVGAWFSDMHTAPLVRIKNLKTFLRAKIKRSKKEKTTRSGRAQRHRSWEGELSKTHDMLLWSLESPIWTLRTEANLPPNWQTAYNNINKSRSWTIGTLSNSFKTPFLIILNLMPKLSLFLSKHI